ncbi:DUF1259 domain-containing protein [Streptomyces calidiresistens]|uniref:DUF1259 domain-containing protein n=1 Tax=Streptomyces calidiresistens TaxID=1485586 RepID=A0A7W3T3P9_9ACTN|nr:DUF1259 domain-containing protein [Streptomyces calidiresistens]MBB0230384.1 DUF1259 domain-containing protein [Streptomyces calidiresistens]
MSGERQISDGLRARRRFLAATMLAPVAVGLSGCAAPNGAASRPADGLNGPPGGGHGTGHGGELLEPVPADGLDWSGVADALGRPGEVKRGALYYTGFPRTDLTVVSEGVTISPALALGSHIAFIRYEDDSTLLMGDLVVLEEEFQDVSDALHARGLMQTAIHKHLFAHQPEVWWTHVHGHGPDAAELARGVRAALDRTATPPPGPEDGGRPDLDTEGIDRALGVPGMVVGGIYKSLFARAEEVNDGERILPSGVGAISAFNFQPVGEGRAALNGDFAMIAEEVPKVLPRLRRGGIDLVSLHHHGLTDNPRLFFLHIWAVDDAVRLAEALRPALELTHVVPLEQ